MDKDLLLSFRCYRNNCRVAPVSILVVISFIFVNSVCIAVAVCDTVHSMVTTFHIKRLRTFFEKKNGRSPGNCDLQFPGISHILEKSQDAVSR